MWGPDPPSSCRELLPLAEAAGLSAANPQALLRCGFLKAPKVDPRQIPRCCQIPAPLGAVGGGATWPAPLAVVAGSQP